MTTPDWFRIEADYRAGIKPLRAIAGEHNITEGAIRKRAKKEDWARDLSAKIAAKAEQLVRSDAVRDEVRKTQGVPESEIIGANAQMQADVIRAHRKGIVRYQNLCQTMLTQLESESGNPELFAEIGEILAKPDDDGNIDKLNDAYRKAISLPQRIDGVKKLAETLKTLIGLERQAFGIADNAEGDKPKTPEKADSPVETARKIAFAVALGLKHAKAAE